MLLSFSSMQWCWANAHNINVFVFIYSANIVWIIKKAHIPLLKSKNDSQMSWHLKQLVFSFLSCFFFEEAAILLSVFFSSFFFPVCFKNKRHFLCLSPRLFFIIINVHNEGMVNQYKMQSMFSFVFFFFGVVGVYAVCACVCFFFSWNPVNTG